MSWRFLATRLNGDGTETVLDYDIPLSGAAITEDLSGPGGITGKITPEIARLTINGGRPLFEPWSTAIYAETNGVIRAGAILAEMNESGADLELDCVGFSGYATGQPYTGARSMIATDPMDEARHIWEHLQAAPGGNLGLVLDDTISPVRLGIPENPKLTSARTGEHKARTAYEADKATRIKLDAAVKDGETDVLNAEKSIFGAAGVTWAEDSRIIEQSSAPTGTGADVNNIWIDKDDGKVYKYSGGKWVVLSTATATAVKSRQAIWEKTKLTLVELKKDRDAAKTVEAKSKDVWDKAKQALQDQAGGEAQPYVLGYWETHDLGQSFDDLAAETPFDYRVVHSWAGDQIIHRMVLGYPQLGARRANLRFMTGENIMAAQAVEYSGAEYASEVLVLGAGEGRAMVRAMSTAGTTGRLRRVAVVSNKAIGGSAAARKLADQEVKLRSGAADFGDDIVVRDHPNAPLGSYAPGDEILIQSDGSGWTGQLAIWCRVLTITIDTAQDTATLTVARAEEVS